MQHEKTAKAHSGWIVKILAPCGRQVWRINRDAVIIATLWVHCQTAWLKKRLGSRQLVLCLDTTKKRIRKMTKGPKYDQISTLPVTVFGNAFKDQLKGPIIGWFRWKQATLELYHLVVTFTRVACYHKLITPRPTLCLCSCAQTLQLLARGLLKRLADKVSSLHFFFQTSIDSLAALRCIQNTPFKVCSVSHRLTQPITSTPPWDAAASQ